MIDCSLFRVLSYTPDVRCSNFTAATEPAFLTSLSSRPVSLRAASLAHHSIEEDTGCEEMIKHQDKSAADVEVPSLLRK